MELRTIMQYSGTIRVGRPTNWRALREAVQTGQQSKQDAIKTGLPIACCITCGLEMSFYTTLYTFATHP
jgi:hypothetical protein